jgi:vacuolar-type H+-ATPase subunit F/Vma7
MTGVAVLGDPVRASGYRLVGAQLLPATTAAEVRRQWRGLPADVGVVLLTPAAAEALGPQALESAVALTVVLPP